MLSPEDRANFKEVGKQVKEGGFPPFVPTDVLRRSVYEESNYAFFDFMNMISLNDDGRIDETEAKLLAWSRSMSLNLTEDDIWEAEGLIHEGFFSS
ncbi:MAG: hypothetical protein SAL07_12705 [Oscillatoria sp. PMC 1051.18]|uniref:hypothetical protein n=1 Tax=Oscillatoria salina TaxID=331517 RepID=UPI0013BC59A3|nr:hypothetical protein [Oscillatoria salina]MBZ8181211.1 hypothetical protein [Oscillatoria salina IIICB1]MEC4895720.1 hypothetical protein [Oscillatoria sp. PMC 1050.18]MEC5030750.1 hypothetical protein [Oscillatoria sp. PMC 1051.18]NET90773.1 hypothetical protein [Kamptonema sp. SIO1D9]